MRKLVVHQQLGFGGVHERAPLEVRLRRRFGVGGCGLRRLPPENRVVGGALVVKVSAADLALTGTCGDPDLAGIPAHGAIYQEVMPLAVPAAATARLCELFPEPQP